MRTLQSELERLKLAKPTKPTPPKRTKQSGISADTWAEVEEVLHKGKK